MLVYLAIWDNSPRVDRQVGTLEMLHEIWPGGQVSQNWEWRASGKGNPDGGTWDWVYNSTQDRVEIYLTSNIRQAMIAKMISDGFWDGSKIPPNQPWFQGGMMANSLVYTDPNGTAHHLNWERVK